MHPEGSVTARHVFLEKFEITLHTSNNFENIFFQPVLVLPSLTEEGPAILQPLSEMPRQFNLSG